jgi:uncharacterized protein (UPF0335 family)
MSNLQTEALKLKQAIEKIERLEGQKMEISEEISMNYKDLADDGFDIQAIKEVVRIRRQDEKKRRKLEEREEMIEHYKSLLLKGLSEKNY